MISRRIFLPLPSVFDKCLAHVSVIFSKVAPLLPTYFLYKNSHCAKIGRRRVQIEHIEFKSIRIWCFSWFQGGPKSNTALFPNNDYLPRFSIVKKCSISKFHSCKNYTIFRFGSYKILDKRFDFHSTTIDSHVCLNINADTQR